MWFAWIEAFSFAFWLILAFFAVALTTATEKEDFGWATLMIAAGLAFAQLFTTAQPFPWVFEHFGAVLIGVVAYAAVGGIWSVVRWWLFVLDAAQHALANGYENPGRPLAGYNKGRIIAWVVYWPASAVGTVLNNFVSKIAHAVYDLLAKTYQRISDNVWKQFDAPKAKAAPIPSGPDLSTGA